MRDDYLKIELTSSLEETLQLLKREKGEKAVENELEEAVHNKIRELFREKGEQEEPGRKLGRNEQGRRDSGPMPQHGPGSQAGTGAGAAGPGAMAGMGAAGMGAGSGGGMRQMMEEMMKEAPGPIRGSQGAETTQNDKGGEGKKEEK